MCTLPGGGVGCERDRGQGVRVLFLVRILLLTRTTQARAILHAGGG